MKTLTLAIMALFISCSVNAQWWKQYPYQPSGSSLAFPADEGHHPSEPVEWWYTVAHVTGDSTGTPYTYMFTNFYYPQFTFDGFRIFNLANDLTGEFYTETLPVNYNTISETHLELRTTVFGAANEHFITSTDSLGSLVPFEYELVASQANGAIDVKYVAQKRPLILDGTGFFGLGASAYTYYYSNTNLDAVGTITVDGVTETFHGTAWIDRQWGSFNPNSMEQYEWFCVRLNNGMDLNIWNIFNDADEIPDTATYRLASVYVDDSTDLHTHDFTFERLAWHYMPDSAMCYSQQWHFVYQDIDLMITTLHNNSEVTLPFRFYEGTTTITGTVAGNPVTGVGFAELLHSYDQPDIAITAPVSGSFIYGVTPVAWELMNPDDGLAVTYNLSYSIDQQNFVSIASGLTDLSYSWDASALSVGTNVWLKVTGYSADSTVVGATILQSAVTVGVSGISMVEEDDLKIFPNPSDQLSQLSWAQKGHREVAIEVFDIMGVKVFRTVTNTPDNTLLDVSSWAPGNYMVVVKSGDLIARKGLVVK